MLKDLSEVLAENLLKLLLVEARQKLPNEKPKRTPGIFLGAESPFKLLLKKKNRGACEYNYYTVKR